MSSVPPTIRKEIHVVETLQIVRCLQLNVNFCLETDFLSLRLAGAQPSNCSGEWFEVVGITRSVLSRIILYIEIVDRLKSEGKAVKGFTEESLNVAYMTVLRNIKLASLIQTYPRLNFCGLTFT